MTRLIDISPRVSPRVAVWPGDVGYRRDVSLDIARGDNIVLSAVTTTLHLGAHADAPSHYVAGGAGIDAMPLEPYYGPCQVIEVRLGRGARIRPGDLGDLDAVVTAPRVLFKTGSFPDPDQFDTNFVSLSPELIEALAGRGVVLVGIDTPSVDPFADKVLEAHQALARTGVVNLEGLLLDHVAPGRYTLVALPLRLAGADAAPVRAALVVEE